MAGISATRQGAMVAQSTQEEAMPLDNASEPHADRRATAGHDEDWRTLLLLLSRAQDVLARLETAAAMASEAVRAGLVAHLAVLIPRYIERCRSGVGEASPWLECYPDLTYVRTMITRQDGHVPLQGAHRSCFSHPEFAGLEERSAPAVRC